MIDQPIRVSFHYFDPSHMTWELLSRDYWTQEAFDSFVLNHDTESLGIDPSHYMSLPWLERVTYAMLKMNQHNDARMAALHESRSHVKQ